MTDSFNSIFFHRQLLNKVKTRSQMHNCLVAPIPKCDFFWRNNRIYYPLREIKAIDPLWDEFRVFCPCMDCWKVVEGDKHASRRVSAINIQPSVTELASSILEKSIFGQAASSHANLLEQKEVFTKEKSSTPTGLVWVTNIAAVLLFWNTNNDCCPRRPYSLEP